MHQYEIRFLRENNRPLIISGRFLGDFHAIRRSQEMAEEDEGLEVWRGMKCIFRREILPKDFTSASGAAARCAQRAGGLHP